MTETEKKVRDKLRKRRDRARNDEYRLWESDFDFERLEKGGGLIDVHEKSPFVDYETPEEQLHTCRMFAHAFRQKKVDCPDIQAGETIEAFCRRVIELWYSKPGEKMFFVGLKTLCFDNDLGFRNAEPMDFTTGWHILPSTDVTVDIDISTLPRIGEKEQMQWQKDGFDSYQEWCEHITKETRKEKNRKELEQYLADRDRGETKLEETGVPRLLYSAIIPGNE
jgi:hypothetical protein